jgi:hypothetical protein
MLVEVRQKVVVISYIRLVFYECFLGHLSEPLISHVAVWKELHLKQWFPNFGPPHGFSPNPYDP